MDREDLRNRFTFHPAAGTPKEGSHEAVRALCLGVAYELNDNLPEGREKSLAITHLEEVMMWSNAAIARNQ